MPNGKKIRERARARRESWDNTAQKSGSKRPGSNKKSWPRGKGRTHKRST